jgi:anti-anti-sigma regulatory factor
MSLTHTRPTDPLFTSRRDGDAVILTIVADLVQPAARQARTAMLDMLETRPGGLLIDLTQVQAIDETGLGALLVIALWARKLAVKLAVIPSPSTRSRLTTARLDGYLTLVEPG